MREKVFEDPNSTIWKQDGHFYLEYDPGELFGAMREDEITPQEAASIQKDPEHNTNPVILACRRRREEKKLHGLP